MKLEHRLAFLTALITAGTTAACLAMAFILVRRSATNEIDEWVVDGAKAAAFVVLHLDDKAERTTKPHALLIPDEAALLVQRIVVYSSTGQRIASRPETTDIPFRVDSLLKIPGVKANKPFDLDLAEGPMRAVLIADRALKGMTVLHAVSRAQFEAKLTTHAQIFASLFVGTLALVVLASRWLGRRLAADVNRVTDVAKRVAKGELTARAGTAGLASPETRNLARELDHMVGELAALMASQRRFISYAAHELRSPLTALQGELQLSLRRPRTEESYVETLGNALTEVASLTHLADGLLTLARAQADNTSAEHARIEDVIEDALRLVQGAAQIQDTSVDVDIEPVAADNVQGSRRDVSRLLRNVLENAIKFGPRGGRVCVVGRRDGPRVVIAIADRGPGIAPKDHPQVFEPFFRGSSKTAGTGLGLAIAKEIARKSGGELTFDETYQPGTRFLVKLCVVANK